MEAQAIGHPAAHPHQGRRGETERYPGDTMKRIPAITVLFVLLSACAPLGINTAQSFDQKLAYAAQVNTSVLTASTAALRAKQISSKDHEEVIRLADQAKGLIDSARL